MTSWRDIIPRTMAVELESVPNERAAEEKENKAAEEGCPEEMGSKGPRCGRPLHNAPPGSDEWPVCLMHSKDPNKADGELFEAFWREFEVILDAAGENEAHFERFSFPKLDLAGRRFEAICRFERATFMQDAHFGSATFTQDAHFGSATFTQDANFRKAKFTHNAYFHFAAFKQRASFPGATFTQDADFGEASFTRGAHFGSATFTQDAKFFGATFTRTANFSWATFTQSADFRQATFNEAASFGWATFKQAAFFEETVFHRTANWSDGQFLESATFRRTKFDPQLAGVPSAVFAFASWSDPGKIVFDDVDLSRALFHNCDVSEVWFTSSVRWAKRGNHGNAVFEESVPVEHATGLRRDGERDYRAIAQLYQQLKKNYDTRLDYWTANEFHFGEMEMKRLVTPHGRPLWKLRRWLHRWLGLTAWYRYASDYGNSYRKPILWLLAVLALFAGLFPLSGIAVQHSGASSTEKSSLPKKETYGTVWRLGSSAKQRLQEESKLVGKSMLVAVDMATFQRNPEYAPAYPWGRTLAIAETLLTSTLFALFLLAIRRQFRR